MIKYSWEHFPSTLHFVCRTIMRIEQNSTVDGVGKIKWGIQQYNNPPILILRTPSCFTCRFNTSLSQAATAPWVASDFALETMPPATGATGAECAALILNTLYSSVTVCAMQASVAHSAKPVCHSHPFCLKMPKGIWMTTFTDSSHSKPVKNSGLLMKVKSPQQFSFEGILFFFYRCIISGKDFPPSHGTMMTQHTDDVFIHFYSFFCASLFSSFEITDTFQPVRER